MASAFGQHRKFTPHARKTSGTQSKCEGALKSFIRGSSAPRSNPLPFYMYIPLLIKKRTPFVYPLLTNEGDMGVYGIAVLSFFSSGISVILILMCGIPVSSSPVVCGFTSFWRTVFGKRRYFTVLWYCSFSLSCLKQVNIKKKKLVGNPRSSNDQAF